MSDQWKAFVWIGEAFAAHDTVRHPACPDLRYCQNHFEIPCEEGAVHICSIDAIVFRSRPAYRSKPDVTRTNPDGFLDAKCDSPATIPPLAGASVLRYCRGMRVCIFVSS
jgi:hypothetical protein